MSVRIRLFYPKVQQCVDNQAIVEVAGNTVGECLGDLIRRYPGVKKWIFDERDQILEQVFVYINAEGLQKADLSTPVTEKDELLLAVLITGG